MTAEHAKRLLLAIKDNIDKFESQYGEIELHNEPINKVPINFGNNSAEA